MSKVSYSVNPKDRVGPGAKLCYSIGFAGKDGFQTIANNYLMMFLMMVAGLDGACPNLGRHQRPHSGVSGRSHPLQAG